MTRHEWGLLLAASLCSLPACSPARSSLCPVAECEGVREKAALADPAVQTASTQADRVAASPYHSIPVTLPKDKEGDAKTAAKPRDPRPVAEPSASAAEKPEVPPTTPEEAGAPSETTECLQPTREEHPALEKRPRSSRITPVTATKTSTPAEIVPVADSKATAAEPPLLAALRCYLDKRPAEALAVLECYEKANQDLLLCLLPLIAQLTEASVDKTSDNGLGIVVDQLNSMLLPLRERAPLAIDKMCFCQSIGGYGNYVALADAHVFRAGELVRLYVELRNFRSDKRAEAGQTVFVTELSAKAEIRDASGKAVWSHEFQRDKPDQSQSLRTDYFEHYRFCIPELEPGSYTMSLSVRDVATKRDEAKRTLDFHVGNMPAR